MSLLYQLKTLQGWHRKLLKNYELVTMYSLHHSGYIPSLLIVRAIHFLWKSQYLVSALSAILYKYYKWATSQSCHITKYPMISALILSASTRAYSILKIWNKEMLVQNITNTILIYPLGHSINQEHKTLFYSIYQVTSCVTLS